MPSSSGGCISARFGFLGQCLGIYNALGFVIQSQTGQGDWRPCFDFQSDTRLGAGQRCLDTC